MPRVKIFVISELTNLSREIVFRVTRWFDGKRIRKNLPTRAKAEAERQALDVQHLQSEPGVWPTVTRLAEDQLHEAEPAFRRLSKPQNSLCFGANCGL